MKLQVIAFSFIWLLCGAEAANGQSDNQELPKVFLLGQHESAYNEAAIAHSTLLLEVCDNNLRTAHEKWHSMLMEMQAYSEQIDFNINGVRIWIHVFWEPNGSINHIGYYLKPQSRNISTAELTAFFKSFSNNYQFPLIETRKYSHYGSASFPLHPIRLKK